MSHALTIHNAQLGRWIRDAYRIEELAPIEDFLRRHRTLEIPLLSNGLAPASPGGGANPGSGYHHVWIRDAVYVAHSRRVTGDVSAARRAAATLVKYFDRHRRRIDDVLADRADPSDPMQRPHVRFAGDTLDENDERWAHAQNDALGYALWLCATLWSEGWDLPPKAREVLAGLVLFLEKIEYWRDADSGHWEEDRRLHLSSVGVVVAGLHALRQALRGPLSRGARDVDDDRLSALEAHGRLALHALPRESPPRPATDAALLFLLEPLRVVDAAQAQSILDAVTRDLCGPVGIKRYLGDSYWCADYRELVAPERRSADFSETTAERDALLRPGTEAQWCIFDPMLSAHFGHRYLQSGEPEDLARQTYHFNRSLAQITGEDCRFGAGKCPEAYFLESSVEGVYRPNDQTPLAWTQANLAVALHTMRRTHVKGRPR